MTLDETTMERLAFIKHLHRWAEDTSRKPQPFASKSLLIFQDAVEMFLQLASEELDANGDVGFLNYWNDILQKSGVELTKKASMKRMNEARVNLKHHGNRPHREDLESYRAEVRSFFEENTPTVFDLDYSDISLVRLIKFNDAESKARQAEKHMEDGEIDDALCQISASYDSMFEEFESRIQSQLGYAPYPSSRKHLSTPRITPSGESELFPAGVDSKGGFRSAETKSEEAAIIVRMTEKYLKDLFRELAYIYDSLKVMSLGIDHWRFQRFKSLTPRVNRDGVPLHSHWNADGVSKETVRFCIDFLVEVAIELQDSPLDFDSEPVTSKGLDEWM